MRPASRHVFIPVATALPTVRSVGTLYPLLPPQLQHIRCRMWLESCSSRRPVADNHPLQRSRLLVCFACQWQRQNFRLDHRLLQLLPTFFPTAAAAAGVLVVAHSPGSGSKRWQPLCCCCGRWCPVGKTHPRHGRHRHTTAKSPRSAACARDVLTWATPHPHGALALVVSSSCWCRWNQQRVACCPQCESQRRRGCCQAH